MSQSPFTKYSSSSHGNNKYTKFPNGGNKSYNPFNEENDVESITFNPSVSKNPLGGGATRPSSGVSNPPPSVRASKSTRVRAFLGESPNQKKGYNPFGEDDTPSDDPRGVEMTNIDEAKHQKNIEKSNQQRNKFQKSVRTMEEKFHDDGSENITEVCISPDNENAIIRFLVAKRGIVIISLLIAAFLY